MVSLPDGRRWACAKTGIEPGENIASLHLSGVAPSRPPLGAAGRYGTAPGEVLVPTLGALVAQELVHLPSVTPLPARSED